MAEFCLNKMCDCGTNCLMISVTEPFTGGKRRCRSGERNVNYYRGLKCRLVNSCLLIYL